MSSSAQTDSLFHGRLRTGSRRLFWVGLAMTLLGVAALIFPVVSTLAVALFAGWVLLTAGGLLVAGAFTIHGTGPFFGALVTGLLFIAGGLFLLFSPMSGAVALTLMMGLLFMFQGAVETLPGSDGDRVRVHYRFDRGTGRGSGAVESFQVRPGQDPHQAPVWPGHGQTAVLGGPVQGCFRLRQRSFRA